MAYPRKGNDIPLLEHGNQELRNSGAASSTVEGRKNIGAEDEDEYGMPIRNGKRKRGGTALLKDLKSRKHGLVKCLVHLPSMAISLGVLSLSFRHIFWERPESNTNAVLNALQFAAQMHGSLIVMSLSAMMLHLVHHGLTGKNGIQLGFLSSSFQLGSISYLFRKEFTTLSFGYITIFMCAFILAMLSGPSSAITMLPRLQFWSISNLWLGGGNVDFHVYIAANETNLYPETLTSDYAPLNCSGVSASILSDCPTFGMRKWMMEDGLFNPSQDGSPTINITIQESWIRYMVGTTSDVNVGIQSVYSASTLSNFLGSALFAYHDLLLGFTAGVFGNNGPTTIQSTESDLLPRYDLSFRAAGKTVATRKPLVEVECAGYTSDATSISFLHDRWLGLLGQVIRYYPHWVDIDQFGSIKPSLGAIFATPKVSIATGYHQSVNQNFSLYTCTIDARWMPTRAFLDASPGEAAIFDFNPDPNGPILEQLNEGPVPDSIPSVYIADSWAKLLDVPWIDSIANPVPTNRTILDTIEQKCLDKNTFINITGRGIPFDDGLAHRITLDPMYMLECLQVSLSVSLSDALARVQDSIPTYFVMEGKVQPMPSGYNSSIFMVQNLYDGYVVESGNLNDQVTNISKSDFADPAKFIEMYMPASRWGYGYGFQDSNLTILGTVILLLHVVLCLVYISWIVGIGEYRSADWDSIGGLVWIAMQSGSARDNWHEVDDLHKEGSSTKRWKERYGLREITTSKREPEGDNTNNEDKGRRSVLRRIVSHPDA